MQDRQAVCKRPGTERVSSVSSRERQRDWRYSQHVNVGNRLISPSDQESKSAVCKEESEKKKRSKSEK